MEGFVETRISWHNPKLMDAWVFVPEDMVERILVLGVP
jgi:hypothetical protein